MIKSIRDIPADATSAFQYCSGQELNRHFALLTKVPKALMNAYPNSDAVARKDHLAAVIDFWSTKRPDSILPNHCPTTVRLTLDYAEYEPMARNWWILKHALVDCGAGIHLFSTTDELAGHLELAENEKPTYTFVEHSRIPSAQMRAFVAQRHLAHPSTIDGRKWHYRAYVLAVGRLRVFVYCEMLALLAGAAYAPPWEGASLKASLTNMTLQDDEAVERLQSRRDFWTGVDEFDDAWKEAVFGQICGVVAEVFRGAANTMGDRFVTLDKCFELFAVDFMMDEDGVAWLLEVNETPAFYESPVAGPIAVRLMESVVEVAMGHMNGDRESRKGVRDMVEVLDETVNLGKGDIIEILPKELR
ncbi:tubulin-tyrosine ligase family-domain-containing protein [Schizothecium vesticola]|uniref:Tubulin-tyrosine ligase family-domain-containing protein n=1 Tax=Schizothecium vesticola TaxID=314040 RepID=A0AA40K7K3_9PEZI|nr:tubulin-tyrosine ligase family-domain-containing protein [Schizothecium vesticola]